MCHERLDSGPVTTRREDGILEVTLDRPKANAIDLATSRVMGEVFADFRDDPDLRVAIVRTAGDKFFCAGWDLKAAADGDAVDGDYGVGGFGGLQELPDLNKPVIAAVHGLAMGGGFELALSVRPDLRLGGHPVRRCPRSTRAPSPMPRRSSCPSGCPYHVAMELLLTGRWMDAEEAHRWGVVNEVLRRRGRPDASAGLGDRPAARSPARRSSSPRSRRRPGSRSRCRSRRRWTWSRPATAPDRGDALTTPRTTTRASGLRREAPAGLEGPLSRPTQEGDHMNRKVMITCALTGAGDTVVEREHVPVTPEQIAGVGDRCGTGGGHDRACACAQRRDGTRVAGGGAVSGGGEDHPGVGRGLRDRTSPPGWVATWCWISTTRRSSSRAPIWSAAYDRLPHVEELLPDICTLDCGELNFGDGNQVYVSTPDMLRAGAKRIQELGVKPEMEIFDTGHLWFASPAGRTRG